MFRVRPFFPTDVGAVAGLVREALRENYPPSLFLDIHNWWRGGFLVAENSGQIVGFVAGVVSSPGLARVLMLAVDTLYRKQGIGTQLMGLFTKECSMRGMSKIELEVRQSNLEAIKFYRGQGFEISHSLEKFYTDGENGYKMIKHL